MMKGCSAGMPPIHVRIITSAIRAQKKNWDAGRYAKPRCFEIWRIGTNIRIIIEANRAITPPSLFGMDRRMAYANRKYHSGLMCGGVTIGLAGVKLSGSPRKLGANSARVVSSTSIITKPRRSL